MLRFRAAIARGVEGDTFEGKLERSKRTALDYNKREIRIRPSKWLINSSPPSAILEMCSSHGV